MKRIKLAEGVDICIEELPTVHEKQGDKQFDLFQVAAYPCNSLSSMWIASKFRRSKLWGVYPSPLHGPAWTGTTAEEALLKAVKETLNIN